MTICSWDANEFEDLSRKDVFKMIPPRSQVINWDVIVNTERFHKREREKRGHYGTPGIRDVERDTLSIIGGRMRCPNNGVGTQEVSMNLSVTWAHRTLDDLSAVRMNVIDR